MIFKIVDVIECPDGYEYRAGDFVCIVHKTSYNEGVDAIKGEIKSISTFPDGGIVLEILIWNNRYNTIYSSDIMKIRYLNKTERISHKESIKEIEERGLW